MGPETPDCCQEVGRLAACGGLPGRQRAAADVRREKVRIARLLPFIFQFGDALVVLRKRSKEVLQVPFDDLYAALQRVEQPEI